jgi:arginyl-tRNA synthetase
MKNVLCNLLKCYLNGVNIDELGDYSFPCFSLAKKLRISPNIIAEGLKQDLEKSLDKTLIEKIDTAGGYLNFFNL